MKRQWLYNLTAGSYAIALHVILVMALLVNYTAIPDPMTVTAQNIVQATMIDEQQFHTEQAKIKQQIADKKAKAAEEIIAKKAAKQALEEAEKQKLRKQVEQAQAAQRQAMEKARLAKLKQARAEREKRQIEREKQRLEEEKKQQALAAEAEAERQRIEAEKKQQAEAKRRRIAEEKAREAEKKRQAELARLEKLKKERQEREKQQRLAEKRRAEEQAKQQEEQAQRARESALKASLEAEAQQREQSRVQGVVDNHMVIIGQKVTRNWNRPTSTPSGLICRVDVSLLPNGDIKAATIIQSSGNRLFDRSVLTAIYKAAPLPLPTDRYAAAKFRQFIFNFNPSR